jgi:hypothetical protein
MANGEFMKLPMLAALALLLPRVLAGQQSVVIAPGADALAPQRIAMGKDTFQLTALQEGRTFRIGHLILDTESAVVSGVAAIRRTEEMVGINGSVLNTDTFAVARAGLTPLRQRSAVGHVRRWMDFDKDSVRGADGDSVIAYAMDPPSFYGNSIDLVLAALPLAAGYTAKLPLASEDGISMAIVTVRGRESIGTDDGGQCEAWTVEVRGGEHSGLYFIGIAERRMIGFDGGAGMLKIVRLRGCAAS